MGRKAIEPKFRYKTGIRQSVAEVKLFSFMPHSSAKPMRMGLFVSKGASMKPKYGILIVDDDKMLAEDAKQCLEHEKEIDIEVDICTDSHQAIPSLSKKNKYYDVVLLDVRMPNLSGTELLQLIKKNFPDIEKPLAEMRFLTDTETIFALTDKKGVILDTLSKGQMVFAVAIGELIEELKGEVEKIGMDRRYKVSVKGKTYDVILHPDLEEGGFWVECPALPGCASQGDTVEEALMMIKDAIEGHLEIIAEKGKKKRKTA